MPSPSAWYSKARFHFCHFSATSEADPDKSIGDKPLLAILVANVISLCNTKKLIENTQLVYTVPYPYTRSMPTRPPGSRAGDIPDVIQTLHTQSSRCGGLFISDIDALGGLGEITNELIAASSCAFICGRLFSPT